jgi:hypothetical protein
MIRFPAGVEIFLFVTASRPALEPAQYRSQWIPPDLSAGVERPVREADLSPPSSTGVKNIWRYASNPQCVFMAWGLSTGYVFVE